MCKNKKYLHEDDCIDDDEEISRENLAKHDEIQKSLGSMYVSYGKKYYFFDVLDLFRRVILAGGLIFLGEEGVVQTFLGIIICLIWFTLLVQFKPYASYLVSKNYLPSYTCTNELDKLSNTPLFTYTFALYIG